jgi:hypothetical protein
MSKLRSKLYKAARILGDIESLSSPKRAATRVIRKAAYRGIFGWLRKLLG